MIEIERKWVLKSLPSICDQFPKIAIRQGYILDGEFELRLRQETINDVSIFTLAVKGSGNLLRTEWESEIPEWVFEGLWKNVKSFLVKDRFKIPHYQEHLIEYDRYLDRLSGLFIAECEFRSVAESEAFKLPNWLDEAADVTNDSRYKNKALASLTSLDALVITKGT